MQSATCRRVHAGGACRYTHDQLKRDEHASSHAGACARHTHAYSCTIVAARAARAGHTFLHAGTCMHAHLHAHTRANTHANTHYTHTCSICAPPPCYSDPVSTTDVSFMALQAAEGLEVLARLQQPRWAQAYGDAVVSWLVQVHRMRTPQAAAPASPVAGGMGSKGQAAEGGPAVDQGPAVDEAPAVGMGPAVDGVTAAELAGALLAAQCHWSSSALGHLLREWRVYAAYAAPFGLKCAGAPDRLTTPAAHAACSQFLWSPLMCSMLKQHVHAHQNML